MASPILNRVKAVILNGKTFYVINATVLYLHTQEKTPENITSKGTVILDETEVSISTRDTTTNTVPSEQEVSDVSTLIERKFNDLSDKVEKRLHSTEDQIIGEQLSNLLQNNINGNAVTSESFLYVDILKNRILELEKQLSEKNTIIKF